MSKRKLKSGDIVEVLSPAEILKTLDSRGTLGNLPFMPEMVQYCGKKFKVISRIEKTCVECHGSDNSVTGNMREFIINDVVFLEELRCSGKFHENCQVGCMVFWREDWLRISESSNDIINSNEIELGQLLTRIISKVVDKTYFCQSTQLVLVTRPISLQGRFLKLLREVLQRDINIYTAIKSIINPMSRKIRKIQSGTLIKGSLNKTPVDTLNLQPGEHVEVKSLQEILNTLDINGKNKGLKFNYGMQKYCGKRLRVRNRLDKLINEATGEMLEIKNTVILENVWCSYDYKGFGCPRARFTFWKEIWLKRF